MGRIYVDFDENVPRYVCTDCHHCISIYGLSLCHIKNRGCCWYYPKFTLPDIHKMVKSEDGLHILNKIISHPGTEIYNYAIHTRGTFDLQEYNKHANDSCIANTGIVHDKTIFFKSCPFVKQGYGCTLPPKFRSLVCNFFICTEIVNHIKSNQSFKQYISERSAYGRWINWEDQILEHILAENGVNLARDLDSAIKVLQDLPLDIYEFPALDPIDFEEEWSVGA